LAGSGRINTGFTVRKVANTPHDTGQLLLMNTDKWKLKGPYTAYGTIGSSQGTASGTGDLYW
jgi:hypothetical protein